MNNEEITKLKEHVLLNRNEIGRCPCCNANIKDRQVSLTKELFLKLYKVYVWCAERKVHEFKIGDVKHLLSKTEYANFSTLIRFGVGLVYRPLDDEGNDQNGTYGLNMQRCREFFRGERMVTLQGKLNQITNEIFERIDGYFHEVPSLVEYIKENGLFDYELRITTGFDPKSVPEKAANKFRLRPIINRETNTVRFEREYL